MGKRHSKTVLEDAGKELDMEEWRKFHEPVVGLVLFDNGVKSSMVNCIIFATNFLKLLDIMNVIYIKMLNIF